MRKYLFILLALVLIADLIITKNFLGPIIFWQYVAGMTAYINKHFKNFDVIAAIMMIFTVLLYYINRRQMRMQRAFVFLEEFKMDIRPNSNKYKLDLASKSERQSQTIYIKSENDGLYCEFMDMSDRFQDITLPWNTLPRITNKTENFIVNFQDEYLYGILKEIGSLGHDFWVERCTVTPVWKNNGNTPAKKLKISLQWRIIADKATPKFPVSPENKDIPGIVVQEQSIYLGPQASCLSEYMEITNVNSIFINPLEMKNLFVWTKAEYEDVFGKKHFTENCYRVQFKTERQYCPIFAEFVQCGNQNLSDENK